MLECKQRIANPLNSDIIDISLRTQRRGVSMDENESFAIEKRSLAEQVYLYLCNSIIGGRFNYGDTLSTKQLAED